MKNSPCDSNCKSFQQNANFIYQEGMSQKLERCRSSLDVTISKSIRNLRDFCGVNTNTLKADEVRKLIAAMQKQRYKDLIINEPSYPIMSELRKSLRNLENNATNIKEANYLSLNQNQLATPKKILCQNKCKLSCTEDKVDGPCLCENCGTIGFLKDYAKNSLLFNPIEPNIFENHQKTQFDEVYQLRQLNERIKLLEKRLADQEEKAVSKDYFKRIVTKIISYFSPKMFFGKKDFSENSSWQQKDFQAASSGGTAQCLHFEIQKSMDLNFNSKNHNNGNNSSGNYNNSTSTNDTSNKRRTMPDTNNTANSNGDNNNKNYYNNNTFNCSNNNRTMPNTNNASNYTENFWKWGEEILKPGVDLKNKICTLLDEKLAKMSKNVNETTLTRDINKKEINIAYVNPKLSMWDQPSHIYVTNSGKEQNKEEKTFLSKRDINKYKLLTGKERFLKILGKTKDADRELLWKNIWNQAKANGHTKADKINIKIPVENEAQMCETELTIREIENILTNKRNGLFS